MKIRMITFLFIVLIIFSFFNENLCAQQLRVKDALQKIKIIAYPENSRPVNRTVAEEFQKELVPQAKIMALKPNLSVEGTNVFRISIGDEKFAEGPQKYGIRSPKEKDWMFFCLSQSGEGELVASKQHLLYALFCRVKEEWLEEPVNFFEKGRLETATFLWMEGSDGVWSHRARAPRHYNAEKSLKELARLGCSHLTVNGLASYFPFEQGPPGEVYHRFYFGNPDLDQFVETELNKGIHSPEYLEANLRYLKENAELALRYGMIPGLAVCSPRTVPDALFDRYPFLRGARVDHPFRSFRPRYTLSLAHPVVRWHYAEMLKKIMKEIPELGYLFIRTNDAGAGFEHTTSLYPGRNGGPYLIREWRTNEEIAQAAGENILRYCQLLRDAGSEINPNFRIQISLGPLPAEEETVLKGMGNRIDLTISLSDKENPEKWAKETALLKRDGYLLGGIGLMSSYIKGIPFPWLCYENMNEMVSAGIYRGSVYVEPPSLVPYDINGEIFKTFHLNGSANIEDVINEKASQWAGKEHASKLIEVWKLSEKIVRDFPSMALYAGYGFYTLRPWVRPFVPNIENIPDAEREYYEKYLNAIFNNPTLVDFGADMLWRLISKDEAAEIVKQCDEKIWQPLEALVTYLQKIVEELSPQDQAYAVFVDHRDRILGLRCYYRTLRNLNAWIAGVHGYIDSNKKSEKENNLKMVREMIDDEIDNMKKLLQLWETSKVDFFPISDVTESMYTYFDKNFADLLAKKIELMEKHKNDTPYINPNFMWRMPKEFPLAAEEYLKY
jgi:hypothetical protein